MNQLSLFRTSGIIILIVFLSFAKTLGAHVDPCDTVIITLPDVSVVLCDEVNCPQSIPG